METEVMKSAIISSCGSYRYDLRRDWDADLPPLVLGMLNPSKADHKIDDPTIVRGVYRAKSMNCGSLIVWNLGAGRATEPSDWMSMADPIGPDNDRHIRSILIECKERNGIAVAGWGVYGDFMNRDLAAMEIAHSVGIDMKCLAFTKDGYPRHPLYVKYGLPLEDFVSVRTLLGG